MPSTLDDALPGSSALSAAAALFRGLADPTRLAILQHLSLGEHRVVDLVGHLDLAQSTVSAHLACLRECGLVESRAQGRSAWYRLARRDVLDLLDQAERVLLRTGDAPARCGRVTGTPEAVSA